MCFLQQTAHRLAAARTIVESPVVDVHADELVGLRAIQITAVLQGVLQSFAAMREAIADAFFEQAVDFADCFGTKVAADDVAAEWEGQAFAQVCIWCMGGSRGLDPRLRTRSPSG